MTLATRKRAAIFSDDINTKQKLLERPAPLGLKGPTAAQELRVGHFNTHLMIAPRYRLI